MFEPDHSLSARQLAKAEDCSEQHLANLRHRGEGPAFYMQGRNVRYIWRDVLAWREANKRRSTSDQPNTGEHRASVAMEAA